MKPNLDSEILVSNLPFLAKVIEKVIAFHLLEHMTENNLLDNLQSACKRPCSTETALLRVQNDMHSLIGQKKGSLLILLDLSAVLILLDLSAVRILLDLSAAFETIDHDLWACWICLLSVCLKHTCVNNCSVCVSVNEVMSKFCHLAFGVPQIELH